MEQKMNRKVDQSNQELVTLMSKVMKSLDDNYEKMKAEFATKEEMDRSHQGLLKLVKTSLDDKMDTILATWRDATTTNL